MTSKEIRAMNFNADRMMEQQFILLQEIAARMAEQAESTPAPEAASAATPSDAVTLDKERERKITEVEEEIAEATPWAESIYARAGVHRVRKRILAVEQARLAELKRGLKEVPRG